MERSTLPEVYLHIGLPKTATTSLQDGVFNQLGTHVNFIGVLQPRAIRQTQLFRKITAALNDHEAEFNLRSSSLTEELGAFICTQNKPLMISEEMFTVDSDGLTWQQKLTRLGKIFKPFRVDILVTVREPIRATYSLYVELYQLIKKEHPTFSSFFWHSNQAKIYRYELLDNMLKESFPNSSVRYISFENIIQGVNVFDLFGSKLAISSDINFNLPLINTKKKSKRGTLSKKLTVQQWMILKGIPISSSKAKRFIRPILGLNIPCSAALIPFYSEREKQSMKEDLVHSCEYLKSISGITYL